MARITNHFPNHLCSNSLSKLSRSLDLDLHSIGMDERSKWHGDVSDVALVLDPVVTKVTFCDYPCEEQNISKARLIVDAAVKQG